MTDIFFFTNIPYANEFFPLNDSVMLCCDAPIRWTVIHKVSTSLKQQKTSVLVKQKTERTGQTELPEIKGPRTRNLPEIKGLLTTPTRNLKLKTNY